MHVLFIPQNLPANFSTHGFGQTLNELNFPEIKIKCFPLLKRCQENDNYQDVTNDSTSTFKGLFKDLVFKSVALVRKFMGYFKFFNTDETFYNREP